MDNRDFDKIFSDGLGEEQHFDFRESDWEEVASHIQKEPKRFFVWWRWLIPILLIVSSTVIYCLVADLRMAEKTIQSLNEKIEDQQLSSRDIVFQKNNQIGSDSSSINSFQNKLLEKEIISAKKRPPLSSESPASVKFVEEEVLHQPSESATEYLEEQEPITLLEEIPIREVALELEFEKEHEHYYLKDDYSSPKRLQVRDRLRIGLTGTWGLTEGFSSQDSTFGINNLFEKNMIELGIRAEWSFNNRWSANAILGFDYVSYNTTDSDDVSTGAIEGLSPDFGGELTNLKFSQIGFNYQLGLKYQFGSRKKWLPYLGLNIAARSNLKQKANASYFYVYQEPNNRSAAYSKTMFKVNSISPFVGVEYRFSRDFSWQIEGVYNFNLWKTNDQLYNKLGIRNTILFHF